jgi:endogenous inhibitor of DNA gyrase (YacG/DUF329 family)
VPDKPANISPLRKPVDCPNCGIHSNRETYPFCSKRCADVDLNRWFSGSYAIPVAQSDDDFAESDEN